MNKKVILIIIVFSFYLLLSFVPSLLSDGLDTSDIIFIVGIVLFTIGLIVHLYKKN